jgi:cytoskeletal protein RodZ
MKAKVGVRTTMTTRSLVSGVILFLLAILLVQETAAKQTTKPLTNDDVVSMVTNALPESTIVRAIQASDTNFDTSATGLIALKNAGVSSEIMNAMLAATTKKKIAATLQSGAAPTLAAGRAPAPG